MKFGIITTLAKCGLVILNPGYVRKNRTHFVEPGNRTWGLDIADLKNYQAIEAFLNFIFFRAFLPLKSCVGEDSSRTCIVRIGVFNPSNYHLSDLLKVSFMVTEILMLEDDNFTVSGEEVIVDLKNVGIGTFSQWTPALAKKSISCFEKALPVRVRSNHIMNTPTGFEAAYGIMKSFLSEKLKKRIQVHNQNYNGLYKAIPKSVLPAEYGGEDGNIQELIDHWKAKVESYRDWFLQEESARSDEAKRPERPKTASDLFGIEGSFRKLEVD